MPTLTTDHLLQQIQADQAHYLGIVHDDLMDIEAAVGNLTAALKRLKVGGGPGASGAGGKAKEAEGLIGELGEVAAAVGKFAGVIGVAVAALLAVPAALTGITYAAMPFVEALSPSTVEAFQREMANLQATVGEALIPIVSYAAASLKEWAGILLPTMRELKPEIDKLASAFSGLMAGGVRVFANVLTLAVRVLSPLITELGKWVEMVGQGLETVAALVSALADTADVVSGLGQVVEFLLNPLSALGLDFASFRDVIGKAIIGLAALAATLLKLGGATETLAKFRAAIQKSIDKRKAPDAGLAAAPKDAAVTGVDDISKKLNERSFVATSGAPTARATDDILEEMLKMVGDIADDRNLEKTIENGVRAALKSLPGGETAVATYDVVKTIADPSATGADAAAAARAAGGGFVGANLARGAKYGSDIYDATLGRLLK